MGRLLLCFLFFVIGISCSERPGKITQITNEVFKDGKGKIFFRYPGESFSAEGRAPKYFGYFEVSINGSKVPLNNIIDIKTLKRQNYLGYYYSDKNYIYVHPSMLMGLGYRFIAFKRKNARFIGQDSRYLAVDMGEEKYYLYNGRPISGLDYHSAKYIYWKIPGTKEYLGLLQDKTGYFSGTEKVTVDLLCRTRYKQHIRRKIIQYLLLKKNLGSDECKVVRGE